jgi:hypothetical protein
VVKVKATHKVKVKQRSRSHNKPGIRANEMFHKQCCFYLTCLEKKSVYPTCPI